MKNARLTLCVVIFFSILAEARDAGPVQLTIKASPQTVKAVATQTLNHSGYTMSSEEQAQTIFVKDMEGFAGFLTAMLLSPSSCKNVAPRQFLTLNFSETAEGTLATISAQIEHTAISPSCQTVRDAPLRKKQTVLKEILDKIRTDAEVHAPQNTAPTMNVDTDIRRLPQGEERWPTLLGF